MTWHRHVVLAFILVLGAPVAEANADNGKLLKRERRQTEAVLVRWSELEDWPRLEAWAREQHQAGNYRLFRQEQVDAVLAYALTALAAERAREGRKRPALDALNTLLNDVPNHAPSVAAALYNRGILFSELHEFRHAAMSWERLLQRYPTHHLAVETITDLAQLYEEQTRYAEAAELLSKLPSMGAAARTDRGRFRRVLLHAAKLFDRIGHSHRGRELREAYLRDFPNTAETPKVLLTLATHHASLGQWRQAAHVYKRVIRSPGVKDTISTKGHARLAWALGQLGTSQRRASLKEARRALKAWKALSKDQQLATRHAVAKAQLIQPLRTSAALLGQKRLALGSQLTRRARRLLEDTRRGFEVAASIGDPETWTHAKLSYAELLLALSQRPELTRYAGQIHWRNLALETLKQLMAWNKRHRWQDSNTQRAANLLYRNEPERFPTPPQAPKLTKPNASLSSAPILRVRRHDSIVDFSVPLEVRRQDRPVSPKK